MDNFFYLYTLIVMFCCACAFAFSLAGFFASRRRGFLYAMGIFAFYFLDLALIFQYEYIDLQKLLSPELFYSIDRPFLRIVIGLGMLQSLWLLILDYLGCKQKSLAYTPALIFVAVCIGVLKLMAPGALQQFWFYTLRQVFLAWCLVFVLVAYLREKNPQERLVLARHAQLFAIAAGITCCIVAEDVLMILVVDPEFVGSIRLLPLYISERNFSENILVLVFAFYAIRASMETLQLRFKEPPVPSKNQGEQSLRLIKHVEEVLPHFCEKYGLTSKEREVLYLMVQGLDNQNIASELCLALGTIKKHAHNIFVKAGVKNRVELLQRFWQT